MNNSLKVPLKISIIELRTNNYERNTATIAVTAFRLMANKLVSDFLLHGSTFFLTNFFQLLFAIAIFNVFARSHFLIITVFHIYQFLSFTVIILYHISRIYSITKSKLNFKNFWIISGPIICKRKAASYNNSPPCF